jgi:hypothetical protein
MLLFLPFLFQFFLDLPPCHLLHAPLRSRTAMLEAVTLVCRATIAAPIYKATFAAAAPSICTFSMFVWSNFVPPRARFFAWLLAQQRIHCKSDSKTCALNNVVFSFWFQFGLVAMDCHVFYSRLSRAHEPMTCVDGMRAKEGTKRVAQGCPRLSP